MGSQATKPLFPSDEPSESEGIQRISVVKVGRVLIDRAIDRNLGEMPVILVETGI